MSNRKYSLAAAAIIMIAAAVAIASAWHDSPIVDEVPHTGAGYSYIADQTYQFNPEHPPLAKDLAGLALLTLHINPNFLAQYNAQHPGTINDQWNFGRQLIYHSGVDPITLVHVAKLPLIIFFILCGIIVFAWTRKIYNSRAALLAVFLFAFSPTIIAHSRLVTTDVAALFGVLFSSFFFDRYLHQQNKKNFWLAAISFGVGLLTKFSTFLLVPYFLILAASWAWFHRQDFWNLIWKTILIMATGFILVVGPVYAFHVQNYPLAKQKSDTINILESNPLPGFLKNSIIWSTDKSILRPYAQYMLGLAMVFQRTEGGNQTYFLDQVSNKSFKSYFPIVFSLKEPIPFLILILASLWFGFRDWFKEHHHKLAEKVCECFSAFAMLLWLVIYLAASLNANLNIGIRHLMPIYGFIFILVAGLIESRFRSKWGKSLILLLLTWYLIEFIFAYPFYLSYYNEFALIKPSWASVNEPRGGFNYVVDSNDDWGQDLWRLDDFVNQNKIQKIYLDYFGWAEQQFYLGDHFIWLVGGTYRNADQFFAANPNGGWLAVSATYFEQSSIKPSDGYYWLRSYKPVTVIGHSIFVWHLTP